MQSSSTDSTFTSLDSSTLQQLIENLPPHTIEILQQFVLMKYFPNSSTAFNDGFQMLNEQEQLSTPWSLPDHHYFETTERQQTNYFLTVSTETNENNNEIPDYPIGLTCTLTPEINKQSVGTSPAMISSSDDSSCCGSVNNSKISKQFKTRKQNANQMNSMLFTMTTTTFCNDTVDTMRDKCRLVGKRGVGRPRKNFK